MTKVNILEKEAVELVEKLGDLLGLIDDITNNLTQYAIDVKEDSIGMIFPFTPLRNLIKGIIAQYEIKSIFFFNQLNHGDKIKKYTFFLK